MDPAGVVTLYDKGGSADSLVKSSFAVNMAQMLRGGVIMDVLNAEQAKIAEDAGAVAVVAMEQVPADVRLNGGVGRMSDPEVIRKIRNAVSIPVMARVRKGHFVEAQILEALGVDYLDESEELASADDLHYINKHKFRIPFVSGCTNLGEALCRIAEGASMIRSKGDPDSGNIMEAVRNCRALLGDVRSLQCMDDDEVFAFARNIGAPYELVRQTKQLGRLPVLNVAAGGVVTPADAALMMQLGCDAVFLDSGVFRSANPASRARAIVHAVKHFDEPHVLAELYSC